MSWNYRVVRRVHAKGEETFSIHEAYYHDDNNNVPHSISLDPIDPFGSTLAELTEDLRMMQAALEKVTLDYEAFP